MLGWMVEEAKAMIPFLSDLVSSFLSPLYL